MMCLILDINCLFVPVISASDSVTCILNAHYYFIFQFLNLQNPASHSTLQATTLVFESFCGPSHWNRLDQSNFPFLFFLWWFNLIISFVPASLDSVSWSIALNQFWLWHYLSRTLSLSLLLPNTFACWPDHCLVSIWHLKVIHDPVSFPCTTKLCGIFPKELNLLKWVLQLIFWELFRPNREMLLVM